MIRRSEARQRFTIVNNDLIEDSRLSWKARAILIFVLSKPDNWVVSERHLATCSAEGVTAVRAGLKELEECGYLKRERYRTAAGTWEWESVVYESPCLGYPRTDEPRMDNPRTGYPRTDEPRMDNLSITNTQGTKTQGVKTESTRTERTIDPPSADRSPTFSFETWFENVFWCAYPNKAGKAKAKIGLAKHVRSVAKAQEVMAGLSRWQASHQWADGFIPHGSTWVNSQMWLDEPESAEAAAARATKEPQADAPKRVIVTESSMARSETPKEERVVTAPQRKRVIPPDWFPGMAEDEVRPIISAAYLDLMRRNGRAPSDPETLTEARKLWRSSNPTAPRAPWEQLATEAPEDVQRLARETFSGSAPSSAVV